VRPAGGAAAPEPGERPRARNRLSRVVRAHDVGTPRASLLPRPTNAVRLGDVQLDAEAVVVLAARFGSQAGASAPAGKSRCHAPGGPPLAY
jgi:hypothetical protein